MASSVKKAFLRAVLLNKQQLCSITYCQQRWSRYDPKVYLEPTFRPEDLEQPLEPDDPRKYKKIKALHTDDNNLADYDPIVKKLTNLIMRKGKKKTARNIVARALENIKHIQVGKYHKSDEITRDTLELDPVRILHQAVDNGKPLLITKKLSKGSATFRVPIPCQPHVQTFKSMNWLIESSIVKNSHDPMEDRLSREILELYNNRGKTLQKKIELHKMCEANKAYAHYG